MQPLYRQPLGLEIVGLWLLVLAALYFFLNTLAIAVAIALHDGVGVIAIWRRHFQNLWITFIGGALGAAFVVFALELGSYGIGLLAFPLLLAVILHFAYRNATGRVADQLEHLAEMNRLHLSTIEALAHAIDAKDGNTHGHIRRVQRAAIALAKEIGLNDELELQAIEAAALLHDIGKLAIPEHILNKPGTLNPTELERMRSHARVGAEILSEVDFPYPVVPIVRHHHENWDGTGYPDGLKGADIPIGARVLSVIDCFDALTSDRPYRRALSIRQALDIIESRRGTMYEPAIVDAFREMCAATSGAELLTLTEKVGTARTDTVSHRTASMTDDVLIAMSFGASLAGRQDRECPWRTLAEELSGLPNVDTVVVFVHDGTRDRLIPLRVSGRHARAVARLSIPVGERVSGWVAAVRRPIINGDAALDLFDAGAESLRSTAAIPCLGPNKVQAVVSLYSTRPEAFSALHQRIIEAAMPVLARGDTPVPTSASRDTRRPVYHRHPRTPRMDAAVVTTRAVHRGGHWPAARHWNQQTSVI
jgi:putative nucleotidyltransferase with HDIG domain